MVSPAVSNARTTGMAMTAVDIAAKSNDVDQPVPMMEQAEETTRTRTQITLAKAGSGRGRRFERDCDRAADLLHLIVVDPDREHSVR